MKPLRQQGNRLLEISIVLILLGLLTFIFIPAPPSAPKFSQPVNLPPHLLEKTPTDLTLKTLL